MSAEPTYNQAVNELESILAELESSAVDVDELSARLGRAAELVRFCKERLNVVRTDVAEVLETLSTSDDLTASNGASEDA